MSDIEDLVRIFRQEATERLDELVCTLNPEPSRLLQLEAMRSAKATAHNLKGAALTVGAQIIAGPCEVFEEEFQAALDRGSLPSKIELETWVQILAELKDIIGNPTLMPLNFGGLAELENGIKDDAEYILVSHPSASPAELVASNAPPSTMQIELSRLEAMRTCLDRVNATEIVLTERAATLLSLGGTLQRAQLDHASEPFRHGLQQLTESSRTLHLLLDELRTLFEKACSGG